MCRMMGLVGDVAANRALFERFRIEASEGNIGRNMQPGHRDGWGIVHDGLQYAGRSALDAAVDPEYVKAAREARGPVGLVHFRKATAGAKSAENSHPFIAEGLAFAHNGSVFGIAQPGQSDSKEVFSRILDERRKGASVEDAIATVARDVDKRYRYTSLTLLVTDGSTLWGLRKIGNDPVACADEACPQEYYTLGVAKMPDGSVVVSQDHEIIGLKDWHGIADGEIVTVTSGRTVSTRKAF
jgi:predicted glutamine amidotransferase